MDKVVVTYEKGIFCGAVLVEGGIFFISVEYMGKKKRRWETIGSYGVFCFEGGFMRLWWLIRWIQESDERKMYKGLPRGCWHCEVLGLCRRPKEEGWKCYNGCMLINFELEEKYRGLPKGCWRCKYLKECRRPKEEGWKCYDGCRIIKEKQNKNR